MVIHLSTLAELQNLDTETQGPTTSQDQENMELSQASVEDHPVDLCSTLGVWTCEFACHMQMSK